MKFITALFATLAAATPGFSQTFDVVYYQIEGKYNSHQFTECINLKSSALRLLPDLADSSSANVFFYLGDSYLQTGQPDSALKYFEREVTLRDLLKNDLYKDYSNSLYNLAAVYNQLGLYTEAQNTARRLLASDKAAFGETGHTYVESFLFYLDILANQGAYQQGANETQALLKKLDTTTPDYYRLLAKYADQLAALGKYAASEREFNKALMLLKAGENPQHEEASIRANLAALYLDKGMLIEAEELFAHALHVLKTDASAENQERYFAALNNYGFVLLALGRTDEAEAAYNEVLTRDRRTYGTDHPVYASTLSNTGLAYSDLGNFATAEKLIREAVVIQEKTGGKTSFEYGSFSNNLGKVLALQNKPKEAIPHLQQALHIFSTDPGKESAEYATALHNLGVAHLMIKDRKAAAYFAESIRTRTALLGAAHPRVGQSYFKLAVYQWMENNPKEARTQFNATFTNYNAQINRYFPGLSEAEKTKFYYGVLRSAFEIYASYVQQFYPGQASLTGELYDLQLRTKGIIFYATQRVRQAIQRSNDAPLMAQYERWLELKEQVASRYSKGDDGKLDSLETVTNNLEKELTKKSTAFSTTLTPAPVSWKQIQKKLNPDEAAIELIRFREYSPDSGGFFTGQVNYAALVVTKTSRQPQWISIPNQGNVMEKQNLNYYRNMIRFNLTDTLSYPVYWGALQPVLKNYKKVFFAPDGVYHQINVNTLFNSQTDKYLFEETQIENLTNTKDLATAAALPLKSNGEFYLVGYPQFAGSKETTNADNPEEKQTRGTRAGILRLFRGGEITPLPGTQTEVREIEQLLKKNQAAVTPRTGMEAHEAAIKSAPAPRVLHVATHGFFLDDPDFLDAESTAKYIENPLLRSGLILAGAEDFINRGQNSAEPSEDGILTAQEVMNLNLEGTELVTLSACETGLGSIKNGEGVYGLKRAFALAGADKIIMSLWNVDDEATQQLMTHFYRFWLEGATKEIAFRQAQEELRKSFPAPFYWGAFILVGR